MALAIPDRFTRSIVLRLGAKFSESLQTTQVALKEAATTKGLRSIRQQVS